MIKLIPDSVPGLALLLAVTHSICFFAGLMAKHFNIRKHQPRPYRVRRLRKN